MAIKRLLIANRGEIAMRILRACKVLGIETVGIYSTIDKDQMYLRFTDQTVCVGPAKAIDSYLNINNIISAMKIAECDAVHPGYGFLAENADFAQQVKDEGFVFVGPDADIIRKMGDKISARQTMEKLGVPLVPGTPDNCKDSSEALAFAKQAGYPVILKATAGGGGRGTRVAWNDDELLTGFDDASSEALNAFGNGDMYVEKFLQKPRHIEIQVMGDGEKVLHFSERDCSVQRRRQKLLEEAPAINVEPKAKQHFIDSCVTACQQMGYTNAGTVEALYEDGKFYFIEMNTRLQVEHPVTEMITNTDLVCMQLQVAGGEKLSLKQKDITVKGHAIECRINAESSIDFTPSPGKIKFFHPPSGPYVRFDSHMYNGCSVPPYYDSMIGKLIVWGEDRATAIERAKVALNELVVDGIKTTAAFHYRLLSSPEFIKEPVHINFVEKQFIK